MSAVAERRYPAVILAGCCVPWDEQLDFDEGIFRRAVELIVTKLTKHPYVFGTAGEGYAVSDRQFEQIVAAFTDETARHGGTSCVGVISNSLTTAIERVERAIEHGVTTFQFTLPNWGTLTDAEVVVFFRELLTRFDGCRFIHYNLPRAGRVLDAAAYRELSGLFENLVGAKHTTTSFAALEECIEAAPAMQFFPSDEGYAAVRDRHECGLVPSAVVTNPERAHAFFEARGEELRRFVPEIERCNAALDLLDGSGAHMDGAYDKALLRLSLPEFPLRLLPPYAYASEDDFARFKEAWPAEWDPLARQAERLS